MRVSSSRKTPSFRAMLLAACSLFLAVASLATADTFTVTNNNDSGAGSLRQAILSANAGISNDDIVFAANVTGSIILTSGTLRVSGIGALTISGPGAKVLTVSGNGASQVFEIITGPVNISGLTIANGRSISDGGGISNANTLTVTNCTISGNSANSDGGAISNGAALTVNNCTISGNSAGSDGGAISNGNSLIITNSTITGNSAGSDGGAISNGSMITVTNCTISGNSSNSDGGGISTAATANLRNTIIAQNSASSGGPDVRSSMPVTSQGYNLIGNSSGGSGFIGTDLLNVNPLLGPLQDNGGPTFTQALLTGSPAIDAVPAGSCAVTTDQRGITRPQGSACDIGAFERQLGVGVNENEASEAVTDYTLAQNYPNPFNPNTTISFTLPKASEVRLEIYTSTGQLARKLASGKFASGSHQLVWDGKDDHGRPVTSGVYLFVLKAGNFVAQRKLVLAK